MADCVGMRNSHPASVAAKRGGLIGCLLLLLCAGIAVSAGAPGDRSSLKQKYLRPSEIPFPADNPYSEAKSALGRMLFFDPILSGSQSKSCASCHNPNLSWSDGLPRAIGDKQTALPSRSPTLLNVAWTPRLGWDGHFRDLENVAFGPINSANNMNLSEAIAVERLSAIDGYVDAFKAVFGEGGITRRRIELALATFQRSIVSTEAPFDRWIKGDEDAISEQAERGFDLFNGKANCVACHSGWAFTDASFHDIGTARAGDIGRGRLFPTSVKLRYAFKTPTLRDAARRAPYMHDGSVATLEEVIDLYDRGGIKRPSRSELIYPLHLSKSEKGDLIAFLRTLTGKQEPTSIPPLPR
jgi:cytochrome c peroxidase